MILTIYSSPNTTHLSETSEIFGIAIMLVFGTIGIALLVVARVLFFLLYPEIRSESITIYIDMI